MREEFSMVKEIDEDEIDEEEFKEYVEERISEQLTDAKEAVEKLMLVDQVFNVVHQRSDMPKNFIQGGTSSLNRLAGREE